MVYLNVSVLVVYAYYKTLVPRRVFVGGVQYIGCPTLLHLTNKTSIWRGSGRKRRKFQNTWPPGLLRIRRGPGHSRTRFLKWKTKMNLAFN